MADSASAAAVDVDTAAAVDLAAAVRARAISPSELCDAFIARVERENPRINAVVVERFAAARAEARAQTERLAHSDVDALPPFFGVPCTIKSTFAFAGLPHAAGSLRRKHVVADQDATAVARMKSAGFVPLGLTNVPEMAFWIETENLVYGRTNNPHHLDWTVGGSSGGEGAIVGAGASPLGLASDVGGSIRLPSFFCGVFGHKPTGGLVPGTGHVPSPSPSLARFATNGPIARSARDLLPALRALAGDDGKDPGALVELPDLSDPSARELESLRDVVVHVVDENGLFAPSEAVRTSLWRAARALERAGARVETALMPELKKSFDMWGEAMQQGHGDGRSFLEWLGDGEPVAIGREVARALVGRGRHTTPALLFALLEAAGNALPIVKGGLEKRRDLEEKLRALMPTDRHVILTVPFPVAAFPHGGAVRLPGAFVYSALWNILEMPATQAPVGRTGTGQPLGVQIVGRRGADRHTIRVAHIVERVFGGAVFARPGRTQ